VASAQFDKLDALNEARVALAERLSAHMRNFDGITPPVVEDACKHVYYFHVSRYDAGRAGLPRDLFVKAVTAEGFPLRAGYIQPLYRAPVYQKKVALGRHGFPWSSHPRDVPYGPERCPRVETLNEAEIFLTNLIYPPLSNADMDQFGEAIDKVFRNKSQLLSASVV